MNSDPISQTQTRAHKHTQFAGKLKITSYPVTPHTLSLYLSPSLSLSLSLSQLSLSLSSQGGTDVGLFFSTAIVFFGHIEEKGEAQPLEQKKFVCIETEAPVSVSNRFRMMPKKWKLKKSDDISFRENQTGHKERQKIE